MIASSILNDTPPPVTGVRAELPQQLERIVHSCLEKKPDRRFQTAKMAATRWRGSDLESELHRCIRFNRDIVVDVAATKPIGLAEPTVGFPYVGPDPA